ncbi:MAG: 5-deoxy-glucuronate isomerase [Rhizobiaceae bacterium]
MPNLKVTPKSGNGKIISITPESAGWKYVGFDLHRLALGQTAAEKSEKDETCLVFITGKGKVRVDGKDLGELGERMSVFEGKPWSVYLPAGIEWSVTATTTLELAVCRGPSINNDLPVRVIGPEDLGLETRGKGSNVRHVTNILPEGKPADSLLVVEVITPGGNTSSYPPHKHDQNNPPHESFLEETYYHRINPPQGFAFQRVYTDKREDGSRELDVAMALEDGDVTLVPKGYHPCATTHGYDLYYLNVMAGPVRTWKFHNAPEHEWLLKA